MIYSRSARASDFKDLQIDDLIKEYLIIPKKYEDYVNSRYKFWEYSLALLLAKELNTKNIIDISFYGNDVSYEVVCNMNNIGLTQITLDDFTKSGIRLNRYKMITLFGVLEFCNKPIRLLNKIGRHLEIGGVLLLTNDDSTLKGKRHIITPEYFLDLSIMMENAGFDVYPSNVIDRIDYEENKNIKLCSIVIQRVGK